MQAEARGIQQELLILLDSNVNYHEKNISEYPEILQSSNQHSQAQSNNSKKRKAIRKVQKASRKKNRHKKKK